MERILICLSLDPFDEHIVRYVNALGPLIKRAQIHLVHVMPEVPRSFPSIDLADANDLDRDGFDPEDLRRYALKLGLPDSDKLIVAVLKGTPSEEILRYLHAWDIDLLFMGKRNHDEGAGYLSAQLASRSPASIWMVPQLQHIAFDKMLVATDFSDPSACGFRCATQIGESVSNTPQLTVFTAYNVPTGYFKSGLTYDQMREQVEVATRQSLVDWLAEQGTPNFPIQTLVGEEEKGTALAILQSAEKLDAHLIVIGSKGRSRLTAFLLGSTTDRLLRYDHRFPVFVARNADDGSKKLLRELFSVE